MTVGKAAERLNVSDSTVRNWIASDLLRARWTAGGHARIEVASVDDLEPILRTAPGPDREAALEDLRRRNSSEPS